MPTRTTTRAAVLAAALIAAVPALAVDAAPPNASRIDVGPPPAAVPATPVAPAAPAAPPAPARADMAQVLAAVPPVGQVVYGRADAPLTVVEYASLSCSHCGAFARDVWPAIQRDYVDAGKVRWIYRNFTMTDPFSIVESMFLACTPEASRPAVIRDVFAAQEEIAKAPSPSEVLLRVMSADGMGEAALEACLKDEATFKKLQADRETAVGPLAVAGTPTFFLNGERWTGGRPLSDFRAVFDAPGADGAKADVGAPKGGTP